MLVNRINTDGYRQRNFQASVTYRGQIINKTAKTTKKVSQNAISSFFKSNTWKKIDKTLTKFANMFCDTLGIP